LGEAFDYDPWLPTTERNAAAESWRDKLKDGPPKP
jgi:hypothetical protein